jgi:regulator of protease activity HflC (stomatin/prohibitin superfamily)
MDPSRRRRLRGAFVTVIVVAALAALARSRPLMVVPAGHRAVVFNVFTGVEQRVLGEGLHLLLPLVQYPVLYSVQTQAYTMSSTKEDKLDTDPDPLAALTKDGQPVNLDLTLTFHPDQAKLPRIYQHFGDERAVVQNVVRPDVRALARMVVARYTVTDIYGARRSELEAEITGRLRKAFERNDLVLESVLLRNLSFSTAFQQAIERKQVAQQNVEKMEYVLKQARTDKERAVVEARGQADAIRLVAASLSRNPQLVQYEYVKRLNPQAQSVVLGSQAIVNLGDLLKEQAAAEAAAAAPQPKGGHTP